MSFPSLTTTTTTTTAAAAAATTITTTTITTTTTTTTYVYTYGVSANKKVPPLLLRNNSLTYSLPYLLERHNIYNSYKI